MMILQEGGGAGWTLYYTGVQGLRPAVCRRSSAARAAHRRQASSHICFGPISPVPPSLSALSAPFDTAGFAAAFHLSPRCARQGTGETGPKQMWELACRRCAARAALDLRYAARPKAAHPWRSLFRSRIIPRLTSKNGEIGATCNPNVHNDLHALRHQSL